MIYTIKVSFFYHVSTNFVFDIGINKSWRVVLPQLSSAFFWLFCGFFVTENVVIDVTVREMVANMAPLYTFQIKKNYPNTCSQS